MSDQLPDRIGVYGGGRMGAGIAHVFLAAGASEVCIIEADAESAKASRDRVASSLTKAEQLGTLTGTAVIALDRLVCSADATSLERVQLVVEAVPEVIALKQDVLGRIEAVAPRAVLATNTSSLSIDNLAAGLIAPERFIGLHFFNPVPSSSLVEIIVGEQTDDALVDEVRGWVAAIGKTPIVVSDSPGFASSRLGVALALEAMRMVEEGLASAEDIDTAMTLGYRHPTGPLRTTDIVGLDVRLAIADHLAVELGARFTAPQILRDKVACGDLGRKTGQGFYDW